MTSKFVKIVVFVPESAADRVREALGNSGAGKVGSYSFASFSTKGIGRFRPEAGAKPAIGSIGVIEAVPEERIETICSRELIGQVIAAMKAAHPYEEVAYEISALEDMD
jgi:hypothetical protein